MLEEPSIVAPALNKLEAIVSVMKRVHYLEDSEKVFVLQLEKCRIELKEKKVELERAKKALKVNEWGEWRKLI